MSKYDEDDSEYISITGKLDLYDDPENGNDLVEVYTKDGEEYIITNKKMAKKLLKYTEDDIDIKFEGTIKEDPYLGITILNVKSFEPLSELRELKPLRTHDDSIPKPPKDLLNRIKAEKNGFDSDDVDELEPQEDMDGEPLDFDDNEPFDDKDSFDNNGSGDEDDDEQKMLRRLGINVIPDEEMDDFPAMDTDIDIPQATDEEKAKINAIINSVLTRKDNDKSLATAQPEETPAKTKAPKATKKTDATDPEASSRKNTKATKAAKKTKDEEDLATAAAEIAEKPSRCRRKKESAEEPSSADKPAAKASAAKKKSAK